MRPSRLSDLLARANLTVSGLVLVGVCVLGWIGARWIGSRTAYLLVYASVAVLVVAWFVGRRRLDVDVVRSDLPARMREGQSVDVTLQILGKKRASTIVVEEHLDASLSRPVRLGLASLSKGQEAEHSYALAPTRRGVFDIGPTYAVWSDPFGLTTHKQQLAEPTTVIVHPATEDVDDRVLTRMWEDPPVRPPVSKPWPTGFEFYGMREYVPGDDLRRVVWAAVARTGRMMVRESEQGITDYVSIVLDTDRDWHSPERPSETFEMAVRVAASFGKRHIKDGFSVSLTTNDGRLASSLRGGRAGMTYLDHLARVEMSATPLRNVSRDLISDSRRGAHFVIVTTHVDKEMTTSLRLLLERGASVVVAKVIWDESDPQSVARAVGIGCQVVQIPVHASIRTALAHGVGGGVRR
jgi:uncharacterized protein (DUF58 family)